MMLRARVASFIKDYPWTFDLLCIALGTFFIASAANAFVAQKIRVMPSLDAPSRVLPPSNTTPTRLDLQAIASRNLLGALRENLNPQAEGVTQEATLVSGNNYREDDLKPCTAPIQVRATLTADAKEWSIAVLYNSRTQETAVFSINDNGNQVVDDAVLVDIRTREVVLRRHDHFELCLAEGAEAKPRVASVSPLSTTNDDSPPAYESSGGGVTKVSDTQYEVERAEVDRALSNLSQVATEARIVPSFKNGKPNGFKLFSIKPGSIFAKIGLQNGDVIQKINGYEMNSPDKALEIYQKLKDATSVTIDMQRQGNNSTVNYNIGR